MNKFLAAFAISTAAFQAQADTILPYSDVFIFGDSLSDSGNAAILADTFGGGHDYGSYPLGQFTNGDTWATQVGLTPSLLGGSNYAYGGARSQDNGDIIPDLQAQVQQFVDAAPSLGANPFAAIWVGGNDFRDFAATGGGTPQETLLFISSVIGPISGSVATLAASGIGDIVVFGLPDVGKLPDYTGTAVGAAITQVVNGYNGALSQTVAGLDAALGPVNVGFFDVNSIFQSLLGAGNPGGFTNWTEACLDLGDACNPDEFVFWDDIHPTEGVHDIVAETLQDQLSPVPLPAGFPLLIGGLGLLGVASRRRKSHA